MKSNCLYLTLLLLFLSACSSTKSLSQSTTNNKKAVYDSTYGYTQDNPIKVGGQASGPANEREYLNNLAGPKGEKISYKRLGSCCAFQRTNSYLGNGYLDMYELTWGNQSKPIILYLNMYDKEELWVPFGLTALKSF